MTEETAQYLIDSKMHPGPRVTPADIETEIASEHYFTALDGLVAVSPDGLPLASIPLSMITICVLLLKNGHRIVGVNEGPVSSANFDASLGRNMARDNAFRQLWPLLGFRLRDKLAAEQSVPPRGWPASFHAALGAPLPRFELRTMVYYPGCPQGKPGTIIGSLYDNDSKSHRYLVRDFNSMSTEEGVFYPESDLRAF